MSVTLSFSPAKAGLLFKSRAGVGRGIEESQVLTQEDDSLGGDEQCDRDVGLAIRHGQEERLKILRLVPSRVSFATVRISCPVLYRGWNFDEATYDKDGVRRDEADLHKGAN